METYSRADRTAALRLTVLVATLVASFPVISGAQANQPNFPPLATLDAVEPQPRAITSQERWKWVADEILAPKGLAAGAVIGTWQTAMKSPVEWEGSSGFTKRVLTNQADNGISKSIEAAFGAIWGEDPRVRRSGRRGTGRRLGYAMKTAVLAPRADGRLAPAWGRFAGAVGSNMVKNAWLPSRLTTPKETALRIVAALLGRLGTNLWAEFGPDLRRRFARSRAERPVVPQD